MTFEHIITVCEETTKYISGLESMNTYTPYITIKLYGVPDAWDDEKIEEAIECEDTAIPLGSISGYLVLGQALCLIGADLLDYCDNALMERGGPLNEDSNLFHITNFDLTETVNAEAVRKLLIELPDIIFTHMHVMPNIISVTPAPLPHEKSKLEQVREGLAEIAYRCSDIRQRL